MKKIESKNFSSEKSMLNSVSKEIKKLMKKNKYQGVIWVLVSDENLENTDYDLFETVESLKNMNKADMNKAALEYKKEIKDNNVENNDNTNFIEKIEIKENNEEFVLPQDTYDGDLPF